jgi:hypothetical protein
VVLQDAVAKEPNRSATLDSEGNGLNGCKNSRSAVLLYKWNNCNGSGLLSTTNFKFYMFYRESYNYVEKTPQFQP